MRLGRSVAVAGTLLGCLGLLASDLAADCKAPLSGASRSTEATSDADRLRIARDDAIARWRQLARHAYGRQYRYWTAAQNKRVNCTGSTTMRRCVVTARPCRTVG